MLVLGTSRLTEVETAHALLAVDDLLIDTSNNYTDGQSEQALGRALAELDSDARSAAAARIITKVDRDPETGVFDAERVRRSFEESLERLGVDHVGLLHLHDPYTVAVRDALGAGGAVEALLQLKDEGLVDRIGIAAGAAPLVQRYVDSGKFDAVLCHNRWTLVDRSAGALFASAKERGMTVFNAAPFGGGLLVHGPREGVTYAYRPASDALKAWTARLEALCLDAGIPLAAAALQFSLRSPHVDHSVVGVSSAERLQALRELAEVTVPEDFWPAVEALGSAPSPVDDSEYEGAE